eukprot:1600804-Rhodomonas_salina.1
MELNALPYGGGHAGGGGALVWASDVRQVVAALRCRMGCYAMSSTGIGAARRCPVLAWRSGVRGPVR